MKAALRLVLVGLTASAWLLVVEGETPVLAQACNPNYAGTCIPPGISDADCAGGTGDGPYFVQEKNIRVVGTDVFGLDRRGLPGIGCEDDSGGESEDRGGSETLIAGYPPGPAPTVLGQAPRPPTPAVKPVRGRVAFTGADLLPGVGIGLGLLVLGTALVVTVRRRRA